MQLINLLSASSLLSSSSIPHQIPMELPNNVDEEETLQKTSNFQDNPYDYFDSNCSTPYVSAPSSPSRNVPTSASYFFSAPTSPIHFLATSAAASFEFNGPESTESMIAADEIFLNGQIRPMKLSSHLKNPQHLTPLTDLNEEEEEEEENETTAEVYNRGRDFRSGSVHRRARSLSPLRNSRFQWQDEEEEKRVAIQKTDKQNDGDNTVTDSANSSASNSRSSSSSSRHSKRWIFLKDLLYRSKSEGREREKSADKEKFWHSISFSSSSKDKSKDPKESGKNSSNGSKKAVSNGAGKRRGPLPSAHERHYTANRAQAEEMRKRTFLPYRQGLIGCLGFNSKGYGAVSGFAKAINPVSSR